MSTANFASNPDPFPIYAKKDEDMQAWCCPECGGYMSWDGAEFRCAECGLASSDPEEAGASRDYGEESMLFDDEECRLRAYVDTRTDGLEFYRVSLRGGYYAGIQILVELESDPGDMDADDCEYYLGMTRAEALRALETETRDLSRALDEYTEANGYDRLAVVGVFSNGSAIYERVA